MSRVYVIHENDTWVEPLRDAFDELGVPFTEWFLDTGTLDLTAPPPDGVFYNRMSASSHTPPPLRPGAHGGGPRLARAPRAPRVNTGRALQLEISKVAQYAALEACGIRTPRTVATIGRDALVEAGRRFPPPPDPPSYNRAGKGLGVRRFDDADALARYARSDDFEPSVDGITLIQSYIDAPEPCITRVEFVGGHFLYAVRVDTSQGFELCPADACRVDDAFCPAGDAGDEGLFRIVEDFTHPLLGPYTRFLHDNGIHIAGIEFIVDRDGVTYTYDVNTNTNYNSEAERATPHSGMRAIAAYLGRELAQLDREAVGRVHRIAAGVQESAP